MIARRLAALTVAALLLRLNVVAVDVACAEHDVADEQRSEQHAASTAAVGQHQHDAEGANADCEAPVRSESCCVALASCSTLLRGEVSVTQSVNVRAHETLALGIDRPLSYSTSPDPPPPKA